MRLNPQEIKNEKVETIRQSVKKQLTVRIPTVNPLFRASKPVETSSGIKVQYMMDFEGDSGILFLKLTETPTIDGYCVRSTLSVEPSITHCGNCGNNDRFVRIHTNWSRLGEEDGEMLSTHCPNCAYHINGMKPEMDVIRHSLPYAIVEGNTLTLLASFPDPIPDAGARDVIGRYFYTVLVTLLSALDDELRTNSELYDIDKRLDETILVRKDRLLRLDL